MQLNKRFTMSTLNLNQIFRPASVAVIGASSKPGSIGGTVLAHLSNGKFSGRVFPVNPKYTNVLNHRCYPDVRALPQPVDLAVICTPASTVESIVEQCGQAKIHGLIVISAGFSECGAEGVARQVRLAQVLQRYRGMRMLGPNCLGLIAPHYQLNASFSGAMPLAGRIAFVSQSGALCSAILDWGLQKDFGFSYLISIGNSLDIDLGDLIDYLAADPWTDGIVMYIESIQRARKFMSAASAYTCSKPIVVYKAGRFEKSAEAARSHTGAMLGADGVYDAAFARAGIVRVTEMNDLFDCAELLARRKIPSSHRLAIVTNAGGPGVMAADALLAQGGVLAQASADTQQRLSVQLSMKSMGNPLDLRGDATSGSYAAATSSLLQDENVDGVVALLTPQAMTDPTACARAVIGAAAQASKPVLTSWMGGASVSEAIGLLNKSQIPTYPTPEMAVRAFGYLAQYALRRNQRNEIPHPLALPYSLEPQSRIQRARQIIGASVDTLDISQSLDLLKLYGVSVADAKLATTPEAACALASQCSGPVALKVVAAGISHKSDIGGVVLDLIDPQEIQAAFEQIRDRAQRLRPSAEFIGVTVQPMVKGEDTVEVILGASRDPVFGPILMAGIGGITAELLRDFTLELPPLNERTATRMLERLRGWPLLNGFRGRPGLCIPAVIETLVRLSQLVIDLPMVRELDINPLLVSPHGVLAVDARFIIETAEGTMLAVCPYPEELVFQSRLDDKLAITLRPTRAEDQPAWQRFLESCSAVGVPKRFQEREKRDIGQVSGGCQARAMSLGCLDYDRELLIVVETQTAELASKFLAAGCLSMGPVSTQHCVH
jgi:acetyltransferase